VVKAVREELGGEVVAIVTTHAHADHFGANATVVKRTGARVFAPKLDEAFLRYPILQPVTLFAGADPPPSLRGGFLLAESSPVDAVIDGAVLSVEGMDIGVVPLAGHSPNQIGLVVDGVFCCADVVLPESVLEKYKIPYLFSVADHLRALARCAEVDCAAVVPGHGQLLDTILPLRDANLALVERVVQACLELCAQPMTPEELLAGLLERFDGGPADPPAYYLLHPTVFAFLSYLDGEGRVRHEVREGRSWWTAV
jgi:glyoxylase-like metal-dependent hydrolase (beta-lactamase superfamily II)